ncbi:MAG TPA: glycosyltransferase family protein [Treponema sp.]|nr:glycosyltransferase family protein [Treponema sp.]
MRIAYSCAGEGFGHAARMVALTPDLAEKHQMFLFVPSSVHTFVKTRLGKTPVLEIPCFTLAKRGNRIDYSRTLFSGLRLLVHLIPIIRQLARQLQKLNIDVVLSDFDPLLPWAARLAKIPIVQMNHPGIVQKFKTWEIQSWIGAFMAAFLEGPWDKRIHVSFFSGDVGPVLRKDLYHYKIRDDGFIAVNLKEEVRSKILPILDAIPGLQYRLFPAPHANFDEALASCSAVVTGGGHQTISEALCMGKPVLAIPQEGQYEQLLNARMLARSGRGTYCTVKTFAALLPRFLAQLSAYRAPRILSPLFLLRDSRSQLLAQLDLVFENLTGIPLCHDERDSEQRMAL